jgi:hypothetical protein
LEDSAAFGIGAAAVGLIQFVLGVLSISLLNYVAQQQVNFRSFLSSFHVSQELFLVISRLENHYKRIYALCSSLLIAEF